MFIDIQYGSCCGWEPDGWRIAVNGLVLRITFRCQICQSLFTRVVDLREISALTPDAERFREPYEVSIRSDAGVTAAKVDDISERGIELVADGPLELQSEVTISTGSYLHYQGLVKYSEPCSGGFLVRVEQNGFRALRYRSWERPARCKTANVRSTVQRPRLTPPTPT